MNNFAVVELSDGTITSVSLDKYLASKMRIIEECDAARAEEKTQYWNRIYNYAGPDIEDESRLKHHFKYKNTDHWSEKPYVKGIRHSRRYQRVR